MSPTLPLPPEATVRLDTLPARLKLGGFTTTTVVEICTGTSCHCCNWLAGTIQSLLMLVGACCWMELPAAASTRLLDLLTIAQVPLPVVRMFHSCEAEPELAAAATTAAPAVVDPPVSRTSAGCPLTMFSLAIWKKPSPLLVIAHCSAVDSMPLSAAVVSGIPAEPALPFVSRTCPLTALTSL